MRLSPVQGQDIGRSQRGLREADDFSMYGSCRPRRNEVRQDLNVHVQSPGGPRAGTPPAGQAKLSVRNSRESELISSVVSFCRTAFSAPKTDSRVMERLYSGSCRHGTGPP